MSSSDESESHPKSVAGDNPAPPELEKYFKAMTKANASDLHIKAGAVPHIRIRSRINATQTKAFSPEQVHDMAYGIMSEEHRQQYEEIGSVDVAYELPDSDRFRINIFRQRGNTSMAIRRVTRDVPDFKNLHLPPGVETIAQGHQGLVLVSGATGSGKSTTIASILQYINDSRRCHIVTIEDPIEYLFEDRKALVSQREIGLDVGSFDLALKYLMREDPDVVLIGEMRDQDTFQAALQAAETGHLVFGTVHASSAAQTIGRVLHLFPPDTRSAYRQTLAANLRAVLCQKLLPCLDDEIGRVPAIEIMISNSTIRSLILEERDSEIIEVIRASEQAGMQSFTKSLLDLIENNLIDPTVAYEEAPNVEELKMAMKGISTSRGGLIGRA